MPRSVTGVYTLPLPPVVPGELILAEWANPTLDDIGDTLTDSLDRYARGGMLAPLRVPAGSAVAPTLSFSSENTTGFFLRDAGELGVSILGVEVGFFREDGLTLEDLLVTGNAQIDGNLNVDGQLTVASIWMDAVAFGNDPTFPTGTFSRDDEGRVRLRVQYDDGSIDTDFYWSALTGTAFAPIYQGGNTRANPTFSISRQGDGLAYFSTLPDDSSGAFHVSFDYANLQMSVIGRAYVQDWVYSASLRAGNSTTNPTAVFSRNGNEELGIVVQADDGSNDNLFLFSTGGAPDSGLFYAPRMVSAGAGAAGAKTLQMWNDNRRAWWELAAAGDSIELWHAGSPNFMRMFVDQYGGVYASNVMYAAAHCTGQLNPMSLALTTGYTSSTSPVEATNYITEVYDVLSDFDPTTGRFTASVTGQYMVTATMECAQGDPSPCTVAIYKNGSIFAAGSAITTPAIVANNVTVTISMPVQLAFNDYVSIFRNVANAANGARIMNFSVTHIQ